MKSLKLEKIPAYAGLALCLFCLCLSSLQAEKKEPALSERESPREMTSSLERYLRLIKEKPEVFGPSGQWQRGEIEVVLHPDKIKKIENQVRLRLIAKGHSESESSKWSTVGIVEEDNYWMWVRDAVTFPSGVHGTYDRILWKSSLDGPAGVVLFPVLATKKIVVNVNYRHATRSWEIELPRGQRHLAEPPEKSAARELRDETGYLPSKCILLGTVAPDSGTLVTQNSVFYMEVNHSGEASREYSKAIIHNPSFSKEELKQGLVKGYIEILIKGSLVKVHCRDASLAYSILLAEEKGLL